MHFLPELFWSFATAILFLIIVESAGWLFLKLIEGISKLLGQIGQKSKPPFLLKVITGLLVVGMTYFWLGIFHLFNSELILATGLVFPIYKYSWRLGKFIYYFFEAKLWQNPKQIWANILEQLGVLLQFLQDRLSLIGGLSIFTILSFPAAFRPIIQFDAIWYHLTIPKLFLQAGNIDYNGEFLRYSVHPYLNFFWNSFFLSTTQTEVLQGLAINIFQWILVILALFFAFDFLGKTVKFPSWILLLGPSLLGIINNVTNAYGAGYNDIYGLVVTLFLIPFLFHLQGKKQINFQDIIWALLAITTLALLKVFFALFSAITLLFLVWLILDKQKNSGEKLITSLKLNRVFWLKFLFVLISLGAVFILPWLIRSFLQTGRILDPIGAPGINEDAYNFAGSKSALTHWTSFVWVRLIKNLVLIPTIRYTPLLGLALLLPLLKKFRVKKYLPIYVLGFIGFWSIYFFSIVSEWRYFLPGVYTLLIILLIFVAENFSHISRNYKWICIAGSILLIVFSYGLTLKTTDLKTDMYIFQNQSLDEYMQRRVGKWIYGYYPSQQSFKPEGLLENDPILVITLQGMAYINHPFLSPWSSPNSFTDLKTENDLVALLQSKNIHYILMKRNDISQICRLTNLKNSSGCDTSMFEPAGVDTSQEVNWYKLK